MTALQFQNLIENSLEKFKAEMGEFKQKSEDVEFLTLQETADLFHAKIGTIHKWKREGTLPYYNIGGKVLVKKREALELLEKSRVN